MSQNPAEAARTWSKALIGGEWLAAADGEQIEVINPATASVIGAIAACGRGEVDAAVAAARRTFEEGVWSRAPGAQRARVLQRVADLIEAKAADIAALETLDNGMPLPMSRALVMLGAETFRYFAGWCTKIHGITSDVRGPMGEFHAYTMREPIGVVGLITPWNGPFLFACNKLAVSLATGCSVILKPPEEAPLSSLLLASLLLEAGVPAGVANVVPGYGQIAGQALAEHMDVDAITFTGSTAVGRKLLVAAGGNMKRLTLELGGKSPVVVFDDADIEAAAPTILRGIFANSGQVCMAGSRLYVQRGLYGRLVDAIADRASKMKVGDGFAADTELGPLISERHLNRVQSIVESGRGEGAEVLAGGSRVEGCGYFMDATVMAARQDMRVSREEIFGPVLVVHEFDSEDEGVALANDTEYGLAAAIWTRDVKRAHRVAKRIRAGTVWINAASLLDRSMPFGGYKMSGWGRENGWEGVEAFLQTKSVMAAL